MGGLSGLDMFSQIVRFLLPVLAVGILGLCFFSLFRRPFPQPSQAYLLNCANGDILPLLYAENSVGRGRSSDIVLGYDTVSRSHAVLAYRKCNWMVYDTRSSSGTTVNGEAFKRKAILCDGDTLTFGGAVMVFRLGAIPAPETPRATESRIRVL